MRKNEITDLINDVKAELKKAKENRHISKVKLKNIFENLRSSLEYAVHDINEKLSSPKEICYFPYGEDEQKFIKSVNINLPNLEAEFSSIYNLIENIQTHKSGDNWLFLMCKLTNQAKHVGSLEVENKVVGTDVRMKGVISLKNTDGIIFRGNTYNGESLPDFTIVNHKLNIESAGTSNFDFQILQNNKLIIRDDIELDLFGFVDKCLKGVEDFIEQLYLQL